MHISKEGDPYLRTMLVQGAHYILGPFGEDSDLRRWGLKLAARGGKNGKKRAVVAVARNRFQRGKQIGTYVGMIPCEDSSAHKQRLGHISKQGNSLLRFLLVEAAPAAARSHPDWRRRYMHLAIRRHQSIAKVAMGANWRFGCTGCGGMEVSIRSL